MLTARQCAKDRHSASFQVTYPYYQAFNSLLAKMELIKRVYVGLARGNLDLELSKNDFLQAVQSYAMVTPYEVFYLWLRDSTSFHLSVQVEILFQLSELAHPGQKMLSLHDLELIDPDRLKRVSYIKRLTNVKAVQSKEERGVGTAVGEFNIAFFEH